MAESEIFINQIGYRPFDSKTVYVSKKTKGDAKEFSLCRKDGSLVYSGALEALAEDELSGGGYFSGDFSEVNEANILYRLEKQKAFSFQFLILFILKFLFQFSNILQIPAVVRVYAIQE